MSKRPLPRGTIAGRGSVETTATDSVAALKSKPTSSCSVRSRPSDSPLLVGLEVAARDGLRESAEPETQDEGEHDREHAALSWMKTWERDDLPSASCLSATPWRVFKSPSIWRLRRPSPRPRP